MAALDLHCGLKRGGRGWGGDRSDLLDGFDSEMQEWEDQLQDMQRKIEELYNEVKARRETTESIKENDSDSANLDITLLPVNPTPGHHGSGYYDPASYRTNCGDNHLMHPYNGMSASSPVGPNNGYSYPGDYYNYPVSYQGIDYHYPDSYYGNSNGDATLEILQGYLGQRQEQDLGPIQMNSEAPNKMFSSRGGQDLYGIRGEAMQGPVIARIGHGSLGGGFEEVENRRNTMSGQDVRSVRHVTWKEPLSSRDPNTENLGCRPSVKQRDSPSPSLPTRTAHPSASTHQTDRKCPLVDRKAGGSPSVLRKFGAMLQENEGKTLIEDGVVTTVVPAELKAPSTPTCQRKFGTGRASSRVPAQKCFPEADMVTPETDQCQDPWAAAGPHPTRHTHPSGERDSERPPPYSHFKGPHRGEGRAPRKTSGSGHPKMGLQGGQPGVSRDLQGQGVRVPGAQGMDFSSDHRMVEKILNGSGGSPRLQKRCVTPTVDFGHGREDLVQRSDMLKVEQQVNSNQRGTNPQRQETSQVSRESSPAATRRSFSRPARPANQRPPSRWATHTPTSKITAPSGPLSRPPSPALKARQQSFCPLSQHTETIIM